MGHHDPREADPAQVGDAVLDGPVESPARAPDHLGPPEPGPGGHVVVVADHGDRERGRGIDDPIGQLPGQRGAGGRVQHGGEAGLGLVERLDRQQHDGGALDGPLCAAPHSG